MGFDLSAALERVGGDQELLKEIADLFLEDAPQILAAVRSAVESGDAEGLQRAAHSLKGSVANFGAEEAVRWAYSLEQMGQENSLSGASDALEVLEVELQKVFEGLANIS